MSSTNEPSRVVIAQRIRNRIIEYLELAASIEAQRAYQAHQVCHVPSEVINQWEDWVHTDVSYYMSPVFSLAEHAAILEYQAVWLSTCDDTPDPMPDLEALIGTEPWERLRQAAEAALAVFARRGKLDEDRVSI